MNGRLSSLPRARATVASLVIAAFAWSLVLAASPQLHARIHRNANNTEHTCAATLLASGSYHHSAPPVLLNSAAVPDFISVVAPLTPKWVGSTFLGASTFEHAPPSRA
jgi:hypothetical protein